MHGNNLVAVYNSQSQAEAVKTELLSAGFGQNDVRLSSTSSATASDQSSGSAYNSTSSGSSTSTGSEGGFFDWLFGTDNTDRDWYRSNLGDGRTAVSVYARDETMAEIGERILERHNPIDIDGNSTSAQADDSSYASSASMSGDTTSRAPSDTMADRPACGATSGEDEVIPIVKEELNVGKRVDETRRRVRSYVVERPVEQQVNLRDETVVIERRPVTDGGRVDPDALQEREFEVIERHERPVVEKRAKAVEEVVVHKDVQERTESVRDTVRETEIEVDDTRTAGDTKSDAPTKPRVPKAPRP